MVEKFLSFYLFIVFMQFSACGYWNNPRKASKISDKKIIMLKNAAVVKDDKKSQDLLDPDDFTGYFDSFPLAVKALAEDRLEDAKRHFEKIAEETNDTIIAPRARFLAAYLAFRLGDNQRAVMELPQIGRELPGLLDTAMEIAASAALALGEPDKALNFLQEIPLFSTFSSKALLLEAEAYEAIGNKKEAMKAYFEYLKLSPGKKNHKTSAKIARLGTDMAFNTNDIELAEKIYKIIKLLEDENPSGKWALSVAGEKKKLGKMLGIRAERIRRDPIVAVKNYEKGVFYFNRKNHTRAVSFLDKAVRFAVMGGRLACKARLLKSKSISRMRRHEEAADLFYETYAHCINTHSKIVSLYMAGKSYMSAGLHEEAITMFTTIEEKYCEHSYADDARLKKAKSYFLLGNEEKFLELLGSLSSLYPHGDMAGQAMWAMALFYLKKNDLTNARIVLREYYQNFFDEKGYNISGRSGYWYARVLQLGGKPDKAKRIYARVTGAFPFSFYMLLAYGRLYDMDSDYADELIAKLAPAGGEKNYKFSMSLLDEFPELESGIELMRMGLTTRVKKKLLAVIDSPAAPFDVHWIVASILRRTDKYSDVRSVILMAKDNWTRRYPVGDDLAVWMLSFPQAFNEEVNGRAKEEGLKNELIWAVMREESGFNPDVESWANAVGLMQLILPTARSMGKLLNLRVNRRTLRKPEINIALGTKYLALLSERFKNHPALVIAAYNAGPGAVDSWINENQKVQTDLFVEKIPYEQTRGYTKRVLATLATYHFLYGENRKVIKVPMQLPTF